MNTLHDDLDKLIIETINEIKEEIININYLEKLKYLFIDRIKLMQLNYSSDEIKLITSDYSKKFKDNKLDISIKIYNNPSSLIKNKLENDFLTLVLQGYKTISILDKKQKNDYPPLNLYPKTGVVIVKDTLVNEKIYAGSIILDIKTIEKKES